MSGDIFVIQKSNIDIINKSIHAFLSNNYEELLKDFIKPSPDSLSYLLLLHILGLEGIAEIPNINIKEFTENLKNNGTLKGLEKILIALFRPLQVIITNPEPAVIDIIIDSPTQLDLSSYTNKNDEEYLNEPSNVVYQALQLSNLDNTTSDSFTNLLSLFIPIGTFFTLHTIPYQEIFMPDYFLREYICSFFGLSADKNPVVLSMLVSSYVETIELNNEKYTSLVGLEYGEGIKNLTINDTLTDDLDLSPVYNLELNILIINKQSSDANLFTSKTYKEVVLNNTSTLLLDFLNDNSNLVSLYISSNLGILDFRPLNTCINLQLLNTINNVYNIPDSIYEDDNIEGKYETTVVEAYDINGVLLQPIEISDGGVYANGKITWTDLFVTNNYEINYKLGNLTDDGDSIMPINNENLMHIEEDIVLDPLFEAAIRKQNHLADDFVIDRDYLFSLTVFRIERLSTTNTLNLGSLDDLKYLNLKSIYFSGYLTKDHLNSINSIPWKDSVFNVNNNTIRLFFETMYETFVTNHNYYDLFASMDTVESLRYNVDLNTLIENTNNDEFYKLLHILFEKFEFTNIELVLTGEIDLAPTDKPFINDLIPSSGKTSKLKSLCINAEGKPYLNMTEMRNLQDVNYLKDITNITHKGYIPYLGDTSKNYWLFSCVDGENLTLNIEGAPRRSTKDNEKYNVVVNIYHLLVNICTYINNNNVGNMDLNFLNYEQYPSNLVVIFKPSSSTNYVNFNNLLPNYKNLFSIRFEKNAPLTDSFVDEFNARHSNVKLYRD